MNAAGRGRRWLVLLFLVRAGAAAADTGATASSLADSAMTSAPDDSGPVPLRRIVKRLEEMVVHAPALHDPYSSETAQLVPARTLRALPVDRITDMIGLRAGVVAHGEDLYVRGGRPGELVTQLQGFPLDDPFEGHRALVPLIAIRDAELVSGGQDAEHGGGLAGVLDLRTYDPGASWEGAVAWNTSAGYDTRYDRVGGRAGGPIPGLPVGIVVSAEAILDDRSLPDLRTVQRQDLLGGSFGWRGSNQYSGDVKLATRDAASRVALEILASREVDRPFDPMWSIDGYTTPCADPDCLNGPGYSPQPAPGYAPYRAADHKTITDERRTTSILSWQRTGKDRRLLVSAAWLRTRLVTSLDGHEDERYLGKDNAPVWGRFASATSDPFYVYLGDEQYFDRTRSDVLALRGDYQQMTSHGNTFKAGAGARYDQVAKREIDATTYGLNLDSLRTYRAFAPAAFAYGQGRWVFEGLVANLGLRAEYFTPGPQATDPATDKPVKGVLSWSPRLGVAYPISVHDVFSLAYVRLQQDPRRDLLYDNRQKITNRHPLGNPALRPATSISYQAAVKHMFPSDWSLQGAVFFRDTWGLVSARNIHPQNDVALMQYEDEDAASAVGTELTVIRARGPNRFELSYTWQDARGTYSREDGPLYGPQIGPRPTSVGDHALDWDRRHTLALSGIWQPRTSVTLSFSSLIGSSLPWTPSDQGAVDADLSRVNSGRLEWEETTNVAARWSLGWQAQRLTFGAEMRNVFNRRNDLVASVDGYPNPDINTLYDDYGAYRNETGNRGGAYYDAGWVPVGDPRLFAPPRTLRLVIETSW